jgi:hypothetical protein
MPTLLANPKMDPALRERVEASVGGARSKPARFRAIIRITFALTVVFTVVATFVSNRLASREFERRRAKLLADLSAQSASLDAAQRGAIARDEALLRKLAGPYPGDVPASDLAHALGRPLVYVRGPLDQFAPGASIDKTAAASAEDAFVRCLVEPPRSRSERDVRKKALFAYTATAPIPNVHRLARAYAADQILSPAFEARVRSVRGGRALAVLEHEVERAHLEEGKKALGAPLLLAVMDEPGDAHAVADLDGERAHTVRVELVEVATSKVLLRARKHVDPSEWSAASRADLSSGLDACALAFDLR